VVKAAGADDLLKLREIGPREGLERRIFFVEDRRDEVYPRVRALGGEPRRKQQLPGLFIVERALCAGVFFF